MKTTILSAATALLLLFSCKKKEHVTINHSAQNTQTYQAIQTLTDTYIESEIREAALNHDRGKLKDWWKRNKKKILRIAGADCIGGLAGFLTGSITPGLGNGVGMLIGGIGHSLKEAGSSVAPGGGGEGTGANPYTIHDYYGVAHVAALFEGLTSSSDEIFDEGVLNNEAYLSFAQGWLVDQGYYTTDEVNAYTIDLLAGDFDYYESLGAIDMSAQVMAMQEDEKLTEDKGGVLYLCFTALEASGSYESFPDYSITIEEETAGSGYDEDTKELLPGTMAVARHDSGLLEKNTNGIANYFGEVHC